MKKKKVNGIAEQRKKEGEKAKRKRTSEFMRAHDRKRYQEGKGGGGTKRFENLKLSKLVFIK